MIKVQNTSLEGFDILEPNCYNDDRGFFLETYQEENYQAVGIMDKFVQDNQSRSIKGVRGSVFDVGVDLRLNSPTFGRWHGVELSDSGQRQIYTAPGIAHGFCVLSEYADLHYKVSRFYDPQDECGLIWNDFEVNINWPVINPIIHLRDNSYKSLESLIKSQRLPQIPPIELK